jgi:hypothetical protein
MTNMFINFVGSHRTPTIGILKIHMLFVKYHYIIAKKLVHDVLLRTEESYRPCNLS